MKSIIFSILAVFATTSLFAQKFEIGVNGGIGYNTAPSIDNAFSPLITTNEKPSTLSLATSIKALYNYHKWQLGIEVGLVNLSYKYIGATSTYYFINGKLVEVYKQNQVTAKLASPSIPVKCVLNRSIPLKNFEVYGGISLGYVFVTGSNIPDENVYRINVPARKYGLSAGLQIGGTYFISKHVGINAEVSGNYMYLDIGSVKYKLVEVPATLGIRYRF